uniref:Uncharacterized protein n=1 Tax=Anguilla anguilla TaxID=7936 RepID=A0A0E9Q9F0_ANGAN
MTSPSQRSVHWKRRGAIWHPLATQTSGNATDHVHQHVPICFYNQSTNRPIDSIGT